MPKSTEHLIEELGGLAVMREILVDFYDRVFDDAMIGFFFWGRDKALLVERQLQFTARAFGVAIEYEGKTIPEAHKVLPILAGHFDRRHQLLLETLTDHRVSEHIRDAWLAFDRSFRRAVLKHSGKNSPA